MGCPAVFLYIPGYNVFACAAQASHLLRSLLYLLLEILYNLQGCFNRGPRRVQ